MDDRQIRQLVETLKKEYDELYVTSIRNDEFIYRPLTRKEYRQIKEQYADEYDAFEAVCNTTVLWPKLDFSGNAKAYAASQLAPQILEVSGFGKTQIDTMLLSVFRQQLESFDHYAEVIIATAFPNISFEEMDNWTKEKLMKYFARAEWALTKLRGVQLEITTSDPSEEAEAQSKVDYTELARIVREQGQDPMFVLRHLHQKTEEPYAEMPLIGGSKQVDTLIAGADAWREGGTPYGRYDVIRKQVQKVSNG
ncbi:hypothetical protein ACK8P5_25665 (plasmid) [Paenibacillus sp. EC2-1]|uniref:hypothetical protein n=1 Tax=Paenibacillus sp. EC2-1 TaxID=3388665 RepID=UPI003BEEDCDB